MADFDKAWAISSSWEGKWIKKPELGSADEEFVGGAYWGTNHGLTGKYVKDFAGWTANRRLEFQKLNAAQCGEIWKATRWKWMRGDEILNEDMAALIFDWFVMRNQKAIMGVVRAIDPSYTVKNWMKSPYVTAYKNTAVGGKPAQVTDGFYGLSALAVQRINALPQQEIFEAIKKNRYAISPTTTLSIKHRYNTFVFGGSQSKYDYCAVTNCDGRQSLMVQNHPQLEDDKEEDNTVIYLLVAAGLTKLLGIW